jgi:YVTN family beta-propeller protein
MSRLFTGQIVDVEMIFNPTKTFTTSGASGVDLQSVATHEAGHWFGISHSAAMNSIMFYALQSGTVGRNLTVEDLAIAQKAYPQSTWLPVARRLFGSVKDRFNQPVPGAIVFVTDGTTGDTLGCDMTLPDGSYKFIVADAYSVYLSIHPIDGTSAIGYLLPSYVNALVDSTAVTLFPAELYNVGDSYDEDPLLADEISTPVAGDYGPFDFVLNEDTSGPAVIDHSPADLAVDVRADAAVVIEFSEAINTGTVSGNFRLFNQSTLSGTAGSALVTADGTLLAFAPTAPLDYSTSYICTLRTGIEDLYGNAMASDYAFDFTTEDEPPLTLSSLVPNKGVTGSIVVVNGAGFDAVPAGNTVSFTDSSGGGTVTAPVLSASTTQLIVSVPGAAGTGNVDVTVGPFTSAPVSFTVLSSTGVPRGYEAGVTSLGAIPRAIALAPDGNFAWVATSAGAISVNADPNSPNFLETTPVATGGGLTDLALAPDGTWVFAVSEPDSAIYVIDPLSSTVIDQLEVFAGPRGVIVAPSGNRAYVPTNNREIQIWDVNEASATNRRPIGALSASGYTLKGKMAIDPAGKYLLALTTVGKLLVFDLGAGTLETSLSLGLDPRDVVIDPTGQRAYVSDGAGFVSIVSMSGFFKVQDVATSGSLRGMVMSPSGEYLYAANRELNFLDVIDLVETSSTYRTVATTVSVGINPVDVGMSPDGGYAYTLVEDSQTLVVTGIGVGPVIRSLSRRAGPPETKFVAAGQGFGANPADLVVRFKDSNGTTYLYAPERTTGRAVALQAPPGAAPGPATISITVGGRRATRRGDAVRTAPRRESRSHGVHVAVGRSVPRGHRRRAGGLHRHQGEQSHLQPGDEVFQREFLSGLRHCCHPRQQAGVREHPR